MNLHCSHLQSSHSAVKLLNQIGQIFYNSIFGANKANQKLILFYFAIVSIVTGTCMVNSVHNPGLGNTNSCIILSYQLQERDKNGVCEESIHSFYDTSDP